VDRIVVTGIGIISAIGESVESNRLALQNSTTGIGILELFKTFRLQK
jgi:3-oxoacyl-(acyl-carrier-protein) synthase